MDIHIPFFEEQAQPQGEFLSGDLTNKELNCLDQQNEQILNQVAFRQNRDREISLQSQDCNVVEEYQSIDKQQQQQQLDKQNNEQQMAKDRAFKCFHKQAINDLALSIIFHSVKFLICFIVLYFRSEYCETNELVKWLQIIKFIEQMTILYIFALIIYFKQKREILKRFYQDVLIKNLDEAQILNINVNFEEHIYRMKEYLIKQFKSYRLLNLIFNRVSSFLQQLLLIAGNCIYLNFQQTDCDINIQWGVFIMLLIGYVFQSAFLACFLMTIASMIVWIPSVTCYLIYTTYKHIVVRQKIKQATQNVKRITAKDLNNIESNECMICLQYYCKKEEIYILPCNSKHHFHSKCISQWFAQHLNCPICRKNI